MGLAPALAAQAPQAGRPKVSRPNILFLMADQLRADCLGCYGNRIIQTPNLDRLARDGVAFTSAYTSVPSCTPARSALLTGLSPWRHGMLGMTRMAAKYPLEKPQGIGSGGLLHDRNRQESLPSDSQSSRLSPDAARRALHVLVR